MNIGIKSSIAVFADDTKLCQEITLAQDVPLLQEDLTKIEGWAATWQMGSNIVKCELMHSGAKITH